MTFWHDMLTARDNATFDFLRFTTLCGGAALLFNATWATIVGGHAFDANGFGMGYAAIIAAGGIGVRIARPTEPEVQP